MARYACPICGDPNAYRAWVTPEPPEGCPHDMTWADGGPVTIKSVSECAYQMKKAWQAAEMRKLCPDAFDTCGNAKPDRIADAIEAFAKAHPGRAFVL